MIKVNATVLESSGAWVNVSWSGVPSPGREDWIGVYSPPVNNTIDHSAHRTSQIPGTKIGLLCIYSHYWTFITWSFFSLQYAFASSTHLKDGRGYLLFRLVNMRAPIIMGFFRGGATWCKISLINVEKSVSGFDTPTLAAVSGVVAFPELERAPAGSPGPGWGRPHADEVINNIMIL